MEIFTAQKMKFSINDFFSKDVQIRRKPRIWSHLLKKSLMEIFIFCIVISISLYSDVRKCFSFDEWISEYAAYSPSLSPYAEDSAV